MDSEKTPFMRRPLIVGAMLVGATLGGAGIANAVATPDAATTATNITAAFQQESDATTGDDGAMLDADGNAVTVTFDENLALVGVQQGR